jgi:hypothetical protein
VKEFPISNFSKDLGKIKNRITEGLRWKYQHKREIK